MTNATEFRRAVTLAVFPLGLLLVTVSLAGAQEASPRPLLDEAQRLITAGRVTDAKTVLEKVVKDFAKKPEADDARKLLERITSVQVLVDLTHEDASRPVALGDCLRQAGYGMVRSYCYIPTMRSDLADYELIVLWQENTDLKYDDLEYAVLLEYVKQGGHVVFITNLDVWTRANPGRAATSCPVLRFAKRFKLKPGPELGTLKIGKGKVYHYANTTLLTTARLTSDRPEVRAEAVRLFEQFLPYQRIENDSRNVWLDPEIVFKSGRVTFRYSQTLTKQAAWAKKALPRMLQFYADFFKSDLANDLSIRAVPAKTEHFFALNKFNLSLLQPKDKLLHQLGMQLYQAWIRPADKRLSFPGWMEPAWADMATTDLLTHLGVGQRYQSYEAHHRREFLRADPDRNRIDVTIPPKPGEYPHFGKCEYIYRDLQKKHGRSIARGFRDIVFLYHEAGQLPSPLSTPQTIRLLSVSVGKDLFPYFRSLGMHVAAVPVDLREPDRLRQLLAEKAAKAKEKPEPEGTPPRPPVAP